MTRLPGLNAKKTTAFYYVLRKNLHQTTYTQNNAEKETLSKTHSTVTSNEFELLFCVNVSIIAASLPIHRTSTFNHN